MMENITWWKSDERHETQTQRRRKIHVTLLSVNLKGRNYLENQSVDGRVILH
jgi:hypothetical protein